MTRVRMRWAVTGFTLFVLAAPLSAQVCFGGPALGSRSSGNIGGGVGFFDGGKQYSAGITLGRSLFGSAGFSYADFDDTDLSLKVVSGGVGYELVSSGPTQVSVCPSFSVSHGFGLEIFGIDVTTTTFSPGVSIGTEAEVSSTVTVIPFARAGVLFQRATADAGPLGEESDSETDGALVLGISLVFNDTFAVGPTVHIPVAAEGGDTRFGVGFAVAIGGSR